MIAKNVAKHPLPVVLFTVFVDLIGFGILIPVIPLLLANPSSPYYLLSSEINLKSGYILLGFLTAAFPVMQFLAAPILGQLSDKFGRKPILAVSLFGTATSYLVFALGIITRNVPLLFASRALDGITGGNISVAQAAIADITDPAHRSRNFGLIGAAFGLGFILGPYIGGKLSDPTVVSWFSATTPFYFAALLSALNVLSVLFIFPETLKIKREIEMKWSKSLTNIRAAFSIEKLRALFITNFLFQAGFSFFVSFFSIFLIHRFNFNQGNIGDYFAYVGLWIAIAQAFVIRNVVKKYHEVEILRVSLIAVAFLIFSFFFPTHAWELFLITPFFAIFNGLSQASLTGLVSQSAPATMQGEILGINASVMALAQSLPPILSGFIAAAIVPEAPILVSSIVILIAGLFFITFYRNFTIP